MSVLEEEAEGRISRRGIPSLSPCRPEQWCRHQGFGRGKDFLAEETWVGEILGPQIVGRSVQGSQECRDCGSPHLPVYYLGSRLDIS